MSRFVPSDGGFRATNECNDPDKFPQECPVALEVIKVMM
jgi:hypothetical protein